MYNYKTIVYSDLHYLFIHIILQNHTSSFGVALADVNTPPHDTTPHYTHHTPHSSNPSKLQPCRITPHTTPHTTRHTPHTLHNYSPAVSHNKTGRDGSRICHRKIAVFSIFYEQTPEENEAKDMREKCASCGLHTNEIHCRYQKLGISPL